ncbi:hypothetical protein C2G38_2029764 [Gigaspora rosea]|uniref:Nitrite/sulphite reductase 4Fe-4S domain-containing protein n=1 Tax=Gigaspora rosea TaxID=44941 RepID=A0A397VYF9_9GLOM|nr:hypothetical protein C2G38_2029764 [Gigaspora rosea]
MAPGELILGVKSGQVPGADDLPDIAQICSCNNVSKGQVRAVVRTKIIDHLMKLNHAPKAGSTWCRYEIGDTVGFAIRIEERYRGVRSPHKLKGGVSGCIRECVEAQGKDFGLIATDKGICKDLEEDISRLINTYQCEWAGVVKDPIKRAQFKQFLNTQDTQVAIEKLLNVDKDVLQIGQKNSLIFQKYLLNNLVKNLG